MTYLGRYNDKKKVREGNKRYRLWGTAYACHAKGIKNVDSFLHAERRRLSDLVGGMP